MADKSISELTAATQINASDLFVLEQGGAAKKLTGQILENWLTSYADGHGGIQSIEKTGTSGLVDTYKITLADTSEITFTVTNGKSITSITDTPSGTAGNGRTHTLTINYNDGAPTTVTIKDGVKGDTGAAWYVHIKYAGQRPTSNADMGNTPDKWIGLYSGTSSTAPTAYTAYTWYEIKGEKGDTGDPSSIQSTEIKYQLSTSGTTVPSGTWLDNPPSVDQGKYLWTRVTVNFNSGNPVVWYSVGYYGINGTGAVSSVNSIVPDSNGNVEIDAEGIPSVGSTAAQSGTLAKDIQDLRTSVDGKQGTISSNGILKCTGSGIVGSATKGTDYGALSFEFEIPTGGWSAVTGGYEKTVTIDSSNSNYGKFLASGYAYQISPAFASLDDFTASQIFVKDISTDNQVPVFCKNVPSTTITLNVVRTVSA